MGEGATAMTDYERRNRDFEEGADLFDETTGGTAGEARVNAGQSPAEIEQQIEETRGRMTQNIDALGEKLSPRNLAQDAVETVGEGARRTGWRVMDFIRENPLPVAAVGLGVTWLMTQRNRSPVSGDRMARYAYTGPERRTRGRGDRRGIGERIGEMAGGARETVTETASSVAQRVGDTAERAQERTTELSRQAKRRVQDLGERARGQFNRTKEENPLMVAAGAAILGLAAGLLLPETQRERQMMGAARDRLADRAGEVASRVADATSEAAQEVKETLRTEVSERGPEIADRVQEAARHVTEQAKQSAGRVREEAKDAASRQPPGRQPPGRGA
jgi:gas vesicle protein